MRGAGLIDVHAHFTNETYIAAAKAAGHVRPDGMPEQYWPRWTAREHIDLMDRAGIQKAILSISSPGVHFGDDTAARALATDANDAAAAIVHAHPERFGFFASLPTPDVQGTLRELPRALDELGAAGIVLMTNSRGRYLGDDRFAPLLAELDRRAAVVLLHPTSTEHHEVVDLGRPAPMLEFLFDTARTVIDYILAGNAERYPAIKLVVPHAGGCCRCWPGGSSCSDPSSSASQPVGFRSANCWPVLLRPGRAAQPEATRRPDHCRTHRPAGLRERLRLDLGRSRHSRTRRPRQAGRLASSGGRATSASGQTLLATA